MFIIQLEYTIFQANNPVLDPLIRKRLYPDQHLEPFDSFLKKQLRLQKKVNTPRSENLPVEMSEKYDTFRVGDKVILNFGPDSLSVRIFVKKCRGMSGSPIVFQRGYNPRRGSTYEISKIYTNYTPWIFKLKNTYDGKEEPGYYLAEELFRLPKDHKFIQDKVIKRFRKGKKKKKLVSFKGMDS